MLETVPELQARYGDLFLAIEAGTVALFLLEYAARLWVADLHPQLQPPHQAGCAPTLCAPAPWRSSISMAITPPQLGAVFGVWDVGFAVAFRLLRFLKLARYSPCMRSLAAAVASERRHLLASAIIMLGLVIATATLMHTLKGESSRRCSGRSHAAMYWSVTTLTTVGYGDAVPVTPAGKLLAGVTMVIGFTCSRCRRQSSPPLSPARSVSAISW